MKATHVGNYLTIFIILCQYLERCAKLQVEYLVVVNCPFAPGFCHFSLTLVYMSEVQIYATFYQDIVEVVAAFKLVF
jgi:hypothetical protein